MQFKIFIPKFIFKGCAVHYTRGREVSRPSKDILAELALLVSQGYKSITLLGQNVNSYGLDKKGEEISFPELLRQVGELGNRMKKEFWVYFTSPHPRDMTDEVLEVIAIYPVLAKQIHLPMQSGDDKVLIKMNSKHNMKKYREIVESIRRLLPEATLFTDIIVGFTGETREQFKNTWKAMDEFKFNMSYTAMYSPRPEPPVTAGKMMYRRMKKTSPASSNRRTAQTQPCLQPATRRENGASPGTRPRPQSRLFLIAHRK